MSSKSQKAHDLTRAHPLYDPHYIDRDIRTKLQQCLTAPWNFEGSFAFNKSYDAPNPTLFIDNAGTIGLPLSRPGAEVLKGAAQQAPFGMGESTMVDTSLYQIQIKNGAWDNFVETAVKDACVALGVNYDASRPRCELYKLLLYETGSHFHPHKDSEKVDGMFATLVFLLPSEFTGGEVHLAHGGQSMVFDCSPDSLLKTNVMAWYTDVTHEIKPVTSGYRLALTYNLIHTTTSLRPALTHDLEFPKQVRPVLEAWQRDGGKAAPEKILCLLTHQYSQANISASDLKGVDAQKIALLAPLASELGFHLGFATIENHLWGCADMDCDCGPTNFAGVDDQEMEFEGFVDLDGKLISEQLEFSENEAIPEDLAENVGSAEFFDEDKGLPTGNEGTPLERCTVL
ncbi:hypothetical protein EIP91_010661 [Steccherinum ochraceum]|uniref:Fe2OG dioxygenase domain-containing protein n=1 Tax=Steccherinum ochraceum TaxID=92696 RepID=A0A4R0RLP9_9APHY|nr:hypothetical protein EIP91_010661 [Steccherinum ochraceum]